NRGVHVDAFDTTAALPGVVERAVDDVRYCVAEVRVGRDVRRVLAAELEPDVDEALGALAIDFVAAAHRAGGAHVSDLWPGDDLRARVVACVDGGDQVFRGSGALKSSRECVAAKSGAIG